MSWECCRGKQDAVLLRAAPEPQGWHSAAVLPRSPCPLPRLSHSKGLLQMWLISSAPWGGMLGLGFPPVSSPFPMVSAPPGACLSPSLEMFWFSFLTSLWFWSCASCCWHKSATCWWAQGVRERYGNGYELGMCLQRGARLPAAGAWCAQDGLGAPRCSPQRNGDFNPSHQAGFGEKKASRLHDDEPRLHWRILSAGRG